MSLHLHAPPRAARPPGLRRLRLVAGGFVSLLLASQLIGAPARAERPAPRSTLSASQAADAGKAITVTQRRVGKSTMLVAAMPDPAVAARSAGFEAARLLDVSDETQLVVAADLVADQSATLTLQRADGSQLLVSVPGVIDAELAPDESWVAAVDGIGRLMRVDATSGELSELAAGPFLGPLLFEADGTLLLLAVSSVEAPWQSRLVRLDPANGAVVALSGDELVYGAIRLADGIAYTAHDTVTGSTVVNRLAPTGPQLVADLGPTAIDVDVAPDGSAVAYEVAGEGIYLRAITTGETQRIGPGSHPRFSPDGELLAVRQGSGTAIVARDGSVQDRLAQSTVTWSDCSEECAS